MSRWKSALIFTLFWALLLIGGAELYATAHPNECSKRELWLWLLIISPTYFVYILPIITPNERKFIHIAGGITFLITLIPWIGVQIYTAKFDLILTIIIITLSAFYGAGAASNKKNIIEEKEKRQANLANTSRCN
ncbi:hypothetical protein J7K99_01380 [bacterium]|nr:hypothetical protein [bacterium]